MKTRLFISLITLGMVVALAPVPATTVKAQRGVELSFVKFIDFELC